MYLIIASDGRTYGPVSSQEVRQWVSGNRANAQTLAQLEGTPDWRPLGSFPEFADLFAAVPPPLSPNPPPMSSGVVNIDVDQEAARINRSARPVDLGSAFSRAWAMLVANFWLLVGASFVIILINSAVGILAGPLMGGLYFLMLKLIRGQKAEFGDAFAGFSICFLPLFLAGLVSSILTFVGIILCVLPGLYLALAWTFTYFIVIDRRVDFWPAMALSMKIVNERFGTMFLYLLMTILINLVGMLCCYVGVFVTLPLTLLMLAYIYEDIFGQSHSAA